VQTFRDVSFRTSATAANRCGNKGKGLREVRPGNLTQQANAGRSDSVSG
jgi:hypothetical protein